MGKNKNAAKSAAEAAASQQTAPQQKVEVIQTGDLLNAAKNGGKNAGLSPDGVVTALNGIKSMVHDNPNAAEYYGIGENGVKMFNTFVLQGFATVLAIECMERKSKFAVSMLAKHPEALNAISEYTGITIDTNLLPAPKKDGTVEVPSEAVKVTKEAQKAIKEEQEIAKKKVVLDPTKIETEEQLKETLCHILVKGTGSENFYEKVISAINFYESYCSVEASKKENKEELLAELKKKTKYDFLSEIASLLGKCTFTIGGMAKFMFDSTRDTKSPVVAFCTLRNASLNKKTGMPQIDDQLVADIVRVLIRWYADSEIIITKDYIAGAEKNIEVLNADAEKNKKAIEQGKKTIENAKNHILEIEKVVGYCNAPSRSVIDEFVANYSDNKSEGFKKARMIASKIMQTYYGEVDVKTVTQESVARNVQQYIGVISNMFLPPMDQMAEYSEANITELEKVAPETKEEKSKNE